MYDVKVSRDGKTTVVGTTGDIKQVFISGKNQFAPNDFVVIFNRSQEIGGMKNSDAMASIEAVCGAK